MIPYEQNFFFVPGFGGVIKFNIENNSTKGFTLFARNNQELKFKKTSIK